MTPRTYDDWFEVYGDPRGEVIDQVNQTWYREKLKPFRLPFGMVLSWDVEVKISWALMHKLVGDAVCDALDEVGKTLGIEYIMSNELNLWGGCFNYRAQRGNPQVLSTHAFGAAVDINPHLGGYGKPSAQPLAFVEAFVKRGFTWGGDFPIVDGMHFQKGKGL